MVACKKGTLQRNVEPGTFAGGVVDVILLVCMRRRKGNLVMK